MRPLMQVTRCESSAGNSNGVSFQTGLMASANSRSFC